MKKKLFILILGLLFLSQSKGQSNSTVYNRNSMSFFLISHPGDSYDTWCINDYNSLQPGDKYDINPLSSNVIKADFERNAKLDVKGKAKLIEEYLNKNNYGKEIISYWFDRKDDGSFSRKNIDARGQYNANESKIILANAKKRGIAEIKDEGNKLLKNSYIVVFDIRAIDKNISKSTAMLTWVGVVDTYIFSLDETEYTQNQDKWFYNLENSEDAYTGTEIASKKAYFDNAQFKLKHVLTTTTTITAPTSRALVNLFLDLANSTNKDFKPAVYQGTGEPEFKEFIDRAYVQAMLSLEAKRPDFKVKSLIQGIHPVIARIGLKEGLKKKQMYKVYEMILNEKTGIVKPKEVASLLATKVVNNSKNLVTDSLSRKLYSKFTIFQQYGKIEKGMYMEQKNHKNLSLYADVIVGDGLNLYSLGIEDLNFITTHGFSGSLLFDVCVSNNDASTTNYYYDDYSNYSYAENSTEKNTSACLRIGYAFGFNLFTPNLKVSPFGKVGYGFSSSNGNLVTTDENGNQTLQLNELTYSYGVKIGYNISAPLQLYLKYENVYLTSMSESKGGLGAGIKLSF